MIKFVNIFVFLFWNIKKISSFFDKMFTKWLKNFRWANTRAGKGFFEEKMANLKVFIAKFGETYRRQHFIHETVKFSIEICSKMILIGNYTCSRSISEKSHFAIINISPNACDFSLILLEPCNFLY